MNLGRTIAFTEAELFDEDGDMVARATFTDRVMRSEKIVGDEGSKLGREAVVTGRILLSGKEQGGSDVDAS